MNIKERNCEPPAKFLPFEIFYVLFGFKFNNYIFKFAFTCVPMNYSVETCRQLSHKRHVSSARTEK